MSWNVLITARVFASVGKAALELLQKEGCILVMPEQFGPLRADELMLRLKNADATLCSPDTYNASVLKSDAAKNLKIISRWGVGFDSIDVAEATRQGIVVSFVPGMLNETVADWTWTLLLGIARRLVDTHNSVLRGEWKQFWGHDIAGKTLGIIGCGRIGQAVAKRASGFDMRVLGYDLQPSPEAKGIQFVSLDELLRESDFVSLHAASTPQNRGLIGEAQLRLMKPSSYLVNTARGSLIDETALTQALNEGWIAGAALDVFSTEPLPLDNPLRKAKNLLMAAHQASWARETGEKVSLAAAQAIIDLMKGRKPRCVVDPKVFESPVLRAKLRPD
jgi:glyoxylate reductase